MGTRLAARLQAGQVKLHCQPFDRLAAPLHSHTAGHRHARRNHPPNHPECPVLMLRACLLTQVSSFRWADDIFLSGADQREGLAKALAGSMEAASAQLRAVRAEPPQLLPEKAPERLLWPAFNYGCTWRCHDRILWPVVVHRDRLACTTVAGARSGQKNERLYVMYFQYVICICGTGDNSCIGLWFPHCIGLWFPHVKITLENPAPLLAGPDRAWSPCIKSELRLFSWR